MVSPRRVALHRTREVVLPTERGSESLACDEFQAFSNLSRDFFDRLAVRIDRQVRSAIERKPLIIQLTKCWSICCQGARIFRVWLIVHAAAHQHLLDWRLEKDRPDHARAQEFDVIGLDGSATAERQDRRS